MDFYFLLTPLGYLLLILPLTLFPQPSEMPLYLNNTIPEGASLISCSPFKYEEAYSSDKSHIEEKEDRTWLKAWSNSKPYFSSVPILHPPRIT